MLNILVREIIEFTFDIIFFFDKKAKAKKTHNTFDISNQVAINIVNTFWFFCFVPSRFTGITVLFYICILLESVNLCSYINSTRQ